MWGYIKWFPTSASVSFRGDPREKFLIGWRIRKHLLFLSFGDCDSCNRNLSFSLFLMVKNFKVKFTTLLPVLGNVLRVWNLYLNCFLKIYPRTMSLIPVLLYTHFKQNKLCICYIICNKSIFENRAKHNFLKDFCVLCVRRDTHTETNICVYKWFESYTTFLYFLFIPESSSTYTSIVKISKHPVLSSSCSSLTNTWKIFII